ncbi:hypothetical protein [uncultured Rheinheimera sp.]|uniref:hypothetical protein n=1 Tax=uncultured Rheinheimera sp. TaxID=400532 RepID=UPI0025948D63|nr:hypothetical protein [uncultured Rheinheimera sp.]
MLKKYLQQIRQGKPVHYGRMLELLPPLFYQKKSEMFKVRQLGSGRWQVNILSEALFSQLEQQALKPASRKEAAQIGDSHQVNTSFGYQLVYHQSCLNRQPEVVVLDGTDKFQSYQAKPTLLLIENEECFFRYAELLPVCGQMLALDFSLHTTDIGFASGSKASSALLMPFYQQYQQIYCAFDFDAAALELFDLLKQRLGDKLKFVTPADFSPWQGLFNNKPKHPNQMAKALELAEKHHFYGLLDALQQKGCFLEQEALLEI